MTEESYTVGELIEELKKYPSDMAIYINQRPCKYCNLLKEVEQDQVDGELILSG